MRFPYRVKHNGITYEVGKDVPIGKEPVKQNVVQDKTASDLSKELKERFGIDMAPQKGKAKLLEAIKEAEKLKKEEELNSEEDEELEDNESDEEEEDLTEGDEEDLEDPEKDGNGEDDSFLDSIINE